MCSNLARTPRNPVKAAIIKPGNQSHRSLRKRGPPTVGRGGTARHRPACTGQHPVTSSKPTTRDWATVRTACTSRGGAGEVAGERARIPLLIRGVTGLVVSSASPFGLPYQPRQDTGCGGEHDEITAVPAGRDERQVDIKDERGDGEPDDDERPTFRAPVPPPATNPILHPGQQVGLSVRGPWHGQNRRRP